MFNTPLFNLVYHRQHMIICINGCHLKIYTGLLVVSWFYYNLFLRLHLLVLIPYFIQVLPFHVINLGVEIDSLAVITILYIF